MCTQIEHNLRQDLKAFKYKCTCGKHMLIMLNLLCKRRDMTILPPPGGPIAPRRCMSCFKDIYHYHNGDVTLTIFLAILNAVPI